MMLKELELVFTDSATEADQTIIKTTCSMDRPDS